MELDDQQAIHLLQARNIAGLEFLVKKYQHGALRTSAFITRDPLTAEDIVQSAFLTVAERIHQFDTMQAFKPWFYRIVINQSLKVFKRSIRFNTFDDLSESDSRRFLIDPTILPETFVSSEETKKIIWKALGRLPAKERAVIVLQYFEEMSEKDIAASLHRPVGTIKWQLFSARKRLKELLSSQFNFDLTPEDSIQLFDSAKW